MAKKRQDLDKLFRENLSDYELSGRQGNWDLLSHLLTEQERKRKNRRWLFFFFLFAVLVAGSWIVIHTNEQASNTVIEQISSSNSENTDQTIPTPLMRNEPGPDSSKMEHHNQNLDSNNTIQPVSSLSSKKTLPEHQINKSAKSAPSNFKQNFPKKKLKAEGLHTNLNAQGNTETTQPEPVSLHTQIYDSETERLKQSQPYIQSRPSVITDLSQPEILNQIPVSATPTESISDTEVEALIGDTDSSAIQQNNQPTIQSEKTISDMVMSEVIKLDSFGFIIVDSTLITSSNPEEILPVFQEFKHFNIQAGVNLYQTSDVWINELQAAPAFGMEYRYPISPKWIVGVGAGYSPEGGYHLHDTATQETYFFDHIISQQAIQIKKLHKFYFPLSVYYQLSPKHSLAAGPQLTYLLNTSSDYSEIQHTTTSNMTSTESNVKGYMDGLKPITLGITLGYRYKITNRFDASARYTQQITSAYINEYFDGINTKPSGSVQFLIHYNF